MKNQRKINFYMPFLVLSLALILGYFLVSVFFLNQAFHSGQQAAAYGLTVEKTNKIIQRTAQLENTAYRYLITKAPKEKAIFVKARLQLLKEVETLDTHCLNRHFATTETKELSRLVHQRIQALKEVTGSDTLIENNYFQRLKKGDSVNTKILATLDQIKLKNNNLKIANQKKAATANFKTTIIIALFGGVMILIVFISFFRMREEIRKSNLYLQELKTVNQELVDVNENLERFAYIASHDLSEPLRKISAYGDMLQSDLDEEKLEKDTLKINVDRILKSTERMQQLIKDILFFARMPKKIEKVEQLHLSKVIAEIMIDMEVTIKEHKAKIVLEELPTIEANPTQMRQLFQNLMSNGIKFRKENVRPIITVTSKLVTKENMPNVLKNCADKGKYWKIAIQDNGMGFNEKYLDKIFTIFQRLEGNSKRKGTGIGLSVCKKICENHQGWITAKSKEGEGSTFFVYLPEKQ